MSAHFALEPALTIDPTSPAPPAGQDAAPKRRVWTVFATWLAAAFFGEVVLLGSCVTAGAGIGIVLGAQGLDAGAIQLAVQEMLQQPLPALLLSLVPFQLGMGIIVLLAAVLSKEPFKQRLGLLPQSGRRLSRLRVATLAAFTVSLALASLIVTSLILGAAPNTPIGTAVNSGSWGTITLVSVLVSLLPAIVEELLFRGYIQRRLLERWSPALSIGVTTLLFAILHADSLQHILAVVPLGVITGLVAYRTNSVKPGMLLHVLHNTGAIGLGAIVRVLTPFIGDEGVGMLVMGAILVLAIIGLPAMVSLLRSASADRLAAASVAPQPAVDALAG